MTGCFWACPWETFWTWSFIWLSYYMLQWYFGFDQVLVFGSVEWDIYWMPQRRWMGSIHGFCHLLSPVINDQWSVTNDQWSMINDQWSMINDQWSIHPCPGYHEYLCQKDKAIILTWMAILPKCYRTDFLFTEKILLWSNDILFECSSWSEESKSAKLTLLKSQLAIYKFG